MTAAAFRGVPLQGTTGPALAAVVNLILQGKINAGSTLTLAAGAIGTVFSDSRAGPASFIGLQPLTIDAGDEFAAGSLYVTAQGKASFTVMHRNNGMVDRTFRYIVLG